MPSRGHPCAESNLRIPSSGGLRESLGSVTACPKVVFDLDLSAASGDAKLGASPKGPPGGFAPHQRGAALGTCLVIGIHEFGKTVDTHAVDELHDLSFVVNRYAVRLRKLPGLGAALESKEHRGIGGKAAANFGAKQFTHDFGRHGPVLPKFALYNRGVADASCDEISAAIRVGASAPCDFPAFFLKDALTDLFELKPVDPPQSLTRSPIGRRRWQYRRAR